MNDVGMVFKGTKSEAEKFLTHLDCYVTTKNYDGNKEFILLYNGFYIWINIYAWNDAGTDNDILYKNYIYFDINFEHPLKGAEREKVIKYLCSLGLQKTFFDDIRDCATVTLCSDIRGTVVAQYSPCDFCIEYEKEGKWLTTDIKSNDIKSFQNIAPPHEKGE